MAVSCHDSGALLRAGPAGGTVRFRDGRSSHADCAPAAAEHSRWAWMHGQSDAPVRVSLPILASERVVLRPLRAEDRSVLRGYLAEPEVARWWDTSPDRVTPGRTPT